MEETMKKFLWVWNDLLVALVISRLAALVGERGEAWHVLTAGAFVAMIVPLAVFRAGINRRLGKRVIWRSVWLQLK